VAFRAGRLIINGTVTPVPTWSLTVAVNSYIFFTPFVCWMFCSMPNNMIIL
jgi:hypothetical protein